MTAIKNFSVTVLIVIGCLWLCNCVSQSFSPSAQIDSQPKKAEDQPKPPPKISSRSKATASDLSPSPFERNQSKANQPPLIAVPAQPTHLALPAPTPLSQPITYSDQELKRLCLAQLKSIPGNLKTKVLKQICSQAKVLANCYSSKGDPIFYFDHLAKNKTKGKRILTISIIHGDEAASGTVAKSWIHRLMDLEPRNSWRVIPLANPDGFISRTRTNSNGVDINRNFPTKHWSQSALKRWKKIKKKDPRRYPGPSAASESETQCLMDHFEEFKPDFIVSIHTPLGVLDFDGPKVSSPPFSPLPWTSLGHFPGSLGRYMWRDHKIPVLTIELKSSYGVTRLEKFDQLQDISGTVAIQSTRLFKRSPSHLKLQNKGKKVQPKKKRDLNRAS